jgi:N-methylhydantoinase B
VIAAAGAFDRDATTAARKEILVARRARATFPPPVAPPPRAEPVGRLSLAVEVVRADAELVARCAACGAGLAHAPHGWKAGAGVAECVLGTPDFLTRAGVYAPERTDVPVVLREYVCPGCARLLETEVVLAGTPREDDVRPDFYFGGSTPARAVG